MRGALDQHIALIELTVNHQLVELCSKVVDEQLMEAAYS